MHCLLMHLACMYFGNDSKFKPVCHVFPSMLQQFFSVVRHSGKVFLMPQYVSLLLFRPT